MNLKVNVVRQDKNSVDCGLAGVSMILDYYGIKKSIKELKEEIKVFEGIGTYLQQLGMYLIKEGFEVEIITMNPHLFTNHFKKRSQKELLNYFKRLLKKFKTERFKIQVQFFIDFLKAGGKIKVKIPTKEDIYEEIKNKRPVFALVTSNFLLSENASFNFHFNLITGIDKKNIYVNDSMWDSRGGKHKYKINDFIYALYASANGDLENSSIMKIKKR